jgi:hypothetical protein
VENRLGVVGSSIVRVATIALIALGLAACGQVPDVGTQITPPVPGSPGAGEIPDQTFRAAATIANGKLTPDHFAGQIGTAFELAVTGDGKEHTLAIDELVDGKKIAASGVTNVAFTVEGEPGTLDITLDGNAAGTFERQAASGASD